MKKIKYILYCASIVLFSTTIFAQQQGITTLYKEQMNFVNPSFVGIDNETNASVGYRKQWLGVNNAPETQTYVFGSAIGKNLGIGISASNDKTFIEKQTNLGIDFSYKLVVSSDTDLYLGVKAGGDFYEVNTAGLNTFNPVSDPSLVSFSSFRPNFGVGATLKKENFYVSASIPRILNTVRARNEEAQNYVATNKAHMYLSAAYDYDLNTASNMVLKPYFMLRYVNSAPVSIDYNLSLSFFESFEIGAMYRSSGAVGGLTKIKVLDSLFFGYSYEVSTIATLANRFNTHEFLLKYKFN